jgi:hypothetical protein
MRSNRVRCRGGCYSMVAGGSACLAPATIPGQPRQASGRVLAGCGLMDASVWGGGRVTLVRYGTGRARGG